MRLRTSTALLIWSRDWGLFRKFEKKKSGKQWYKQKIWSHKNKKNTFWFILESLDNDPQIGNLIDAVSNYEIEADQFYRKNGGFMNPYIYMMKMLLGGVCPEWDEKD